MADWQHLESIEKLESLIKYSFQHPVLIFKNSTRCNISAIAKMRVEDQWHFPEGEEVAIYCLDIISFRHISNYIADTFSVYHESPQLLLIQKGKCTYHASHFNIHLDDLKELI